MLILALLLIPALAGIVAFGMKADEPRRRLLVFVGLFHVGLTAATWFWPTASEPGDWIQLDPLGQLFLSVTSIVFATSTLALWGTLRLESRVQSSDQEFAAPRNGSEAVLAGSLLVLLSCLTFVTVVQHLGLLWFMLNGVALSSIPLIFFRRSTDSLDKVRAHLLTCFVGISLALIGNFLLVQSASRISEGPVSFVVSDLILHAGSLDVEWLKLAFLFYLVGYGVVIGIAPVHFCRVETQSEALPALAAILSGAVVNCAFLGLLRVLQVCHAAGLNSHTHSLLVGAGLLSLLCAWVLIVATREIPCLLAALSLGGMGVQILGLGLGGVAVSGTLLSVVGSGLTITLLFLLSDNILRTFQTRFVSNVSGLYHRLPWTGLVWLLGLLALGGIPPFAPFLSQIVILKGAFDGGQFVIGGIFLALLTLIVMRVSTIAIRMCRQNSNGESGRGGIEHEWTHIGPPLVLAGLVVLLSFYIPPHLTEAFQKAAQTLGGTGW